MTWYVVGHKGELNAFLDFIASLQFMCWKYAMGTGSRSFKNIITDVFRSLESISVISGVGLWVGGNFVAQSCFGGTSLKAQGTLNSISA